jgi:hypothetical protein
LAFKGRHNLRDEKGKMGILNISDKWALMGKKGKQGCESHVDK